MEEKKTIGHYIRELKAQDKPLRYLVSRLLWKTGICRLFTIDKGQFKLRFYPSNVSAGCWYRQNVFEADENFFQLYLKEGDTVIDIGANIGVLTLSAAVLVGAKGKVFSIVPHPVIFRYLQGNIRLNDFKNVEAFNTAIGDKDGETEISDRKTADDYNIIVSTGGIKIKARTLDSLLCDKVEKIDFLKVDVEGYEKFVFLGGRRLLEKTKCIYFESNKEHFQRFGYLTGDIFDILHQAGFRIFKQDGDKLRKLPNTYVSEDTENLIAIRDLDDFAKRTGLVVRN